VHVKSPNRVREVREEMRKLEVEEGWREGADAHRNRRRELPVPAGAGEEIRRPGGELRGEEERGDGGGGGLFKGGLGLGRKLGFRGEARSNGCWHRRACAGLWPEVEGEPDMQGPHVSARGEWGLTVWGGETGWAVGRFGRSAETVPRGLFLPFLFFCFFFFSN
jgi:hypothetical protein